MSFGDGGWDRLGRGLEKGRRWGWNRLGKGSRNGRGQNEAGKWMGCKQKVLEKGKGWEQKGLQREENGMG